jgi:hypothetical protein
MAQGTMFNGVLVCDIEITGACGIFMYYIGCVKYPFLCDNAPMMPTQKRDNKWYA